MSSFKPIPLNGSRKLPWKVMALAALILMAAGSYLVYRYFFRPSSQRWSEYRQFNEDRTKFDEILLRPGMRCENAPFAFPTTGAVFGLWNQSYRPGHRHAGLDIFSGDEPGVTPIYTAYPGYLTREEDWLSTVIIRIPEDPLNPGRQIWTYYTHMANVAGTKSFISGQFPMGTNEVYVEAGTFLGYQGNFSGDPGTATGLHLHFSVVKDDGKGQFLNELDIANTYDPSPYFNLRMNNDENPDEFPICAGQMVYEDWDLVGENE